MSSQESCGSENGLLGSRPRRGDVQYQGNGGGGGGGYQQYSSQDSLPDSPYSSQSLDSHAGQTTGNGGQTFFMVMMGISFFFGQLNAIVEAIFSQTTGHRFISLQCVCSLSLFLGLYYVIINTWMSTFTSSKVILMIFSQTPGGRCRTWTRCEEAEWEVISRLLLTLPMGSVRLVIVFVFIFVFVVKFQCIFLKHYFRDRSVDHVLHHGIKSRSIV